jgi:hypothetical protein
MVSMAVAHRTVISSRDLIDIHRIVIQLPLFTLHFIIGSAIYLSFEQPIFIAPIAPPTFGRGGTFARSLIIDEAIEIWDVIPILNIVGRSTFGHDRLEID